MDRAHSIQHPTISTEHIAAHSTALRAQSSKRTKAHRTEDGSQSTASTENTENTESTENTASRKQSVSYVPAFRAQGTT